MTTNDREHLHFEWHTWSSLTDYQLQECADLFSDHYGIWSEKGVNPGSRVRLSVGKLKSDWSGGNVWAAFCRYHGQLIGYAIAVRGSLKGRGGVSWVTQLVVHSGHRHQKIATELLQSIWAFSDDFAWGLVTANPFTVRALEKATRRRCTPASIGIYKSLLCGMANEHIPFVREKKITIAKDKAIVDTGFHVDHSNLDEMVAVASKVDPWTLGELAAGEEWFAFTFREQEPFDLTSEEFDLLMADSERSVRQAYERMSLDSNHLWASHTKSESEFIKATMSVTQGASLLDFGCGTGRHSIEMACLGLHVVGVDFLDTLVSKARAMATQRQLKNIEFLKGDCRDVQLDREFEFGISLYDVIGSFRQDAANISILRNFAKHIKVGGKVLISTMNLELTAKKAKNVGVLPRDLNKIMALKPSHTMQHTGNIFDPDYYFLDVSDNVVYRKEQFDEDLKLPAQIIVADRRYARDELAQLCERVGLKQIWCRCVRAGDWNTELSETDAHAKEILFFGQKMG